jgi:hypothetical protein
MTSLQSRLVLALIALIGLDQRLLIPFRIPVRGLWKDSLANANGR